MSAASKKKKLTQLYGISTSKIDSKLSALKAIICDVSDCILLDYLLKADLDVDNAINIHFGNTPSPSPNHNNVNVHNGNRRKQMNNSYYSEDESSILVETNTNTNISINDQHIVCRKRKREITPTDIMNKRRRVFVNDENAKENTHNNDSNNDIWNCHVCTFKNKADVKVCGVCEVERKMEMKPPKNDNPKKIEKNKEINALTNKTPQNKKQKITIKQDKENALNFVTNIMNSSLPKAKIKKKCSVMYFIPFSFFNLIVFLLDLFQMKAERDSDDEAKEIEVNETLEEIMSSLTAKHRDIMRVLAEQSQEYGLGLAHSIWYNRCMDLSLVTNRFEFKEYIDTFNDYEVINEVKNYSGDYVYTIPKNIKVCDLRMESVGDKIDWETFSFALPSSDDFDVLSKSFLDIHQKLLAEYGYEFDAKYIWSFINISFNTLIQSTKNDKNKMRIFIVKSLLIDLVQFENAKEYFVNTQIVFVMKTQILFLLELGMLGHTDPIARFEHFEAFLGILELQLSDANYDDFMQRIVKKYISKLPKTLLLFYQNKDYEDEQIPKKILTLLCEHGYQCKSYDYNWKRKEFASIRVKWKNLRKLNYIKTAYDLSRAIRFGQVNMESIEMTSGAFLVQDTTAEAHEFWTKVLEENGISSSFCKLVMAKVKPPSDEQKANYKEKCEEAKQQCSRDVAEKFNMSVDRISRYIGLKIYLDDRIKKALEEVPKPGFNTGRTADLQFSLSRRRHNLAQTSFDCEIPRTISLCGDRQFHEDIMNAVSFRYDNGYTLKGLLNLAQRDEYEITESNNNESYEHGLNICLHDYQLQSLEWMIDEENHSIGFYRKFYKKGKFGDQSEFYYSATFDNLIVDDSLPVAHGGFLCEEMGLGKTIISLALISCNKLSNMNEYSTKRNLKIESTETRKKLRWENSDPEHPKQIDYFVEYTWYKSSATLIIAPKTLIGQWEKECDERSDGKINYIRYYGQRSRDIKKYIDKDIVFTTYGILGWEDGDDRSKHVLHQIYWHRIILDESHTIKSGDTNQTKNIKALRGRNKWCVTGTPFNSSVLDIGQQLLFIGMRQNHLRALDLSTIAKCKVFQGRGLDAYYRDKSKLCKIMNVIKLMVMRHIKAQQFNEREIVSMPEKEENVIFIDFTAQQKEYYEKLYKTARERYDFYKSTGNIGKGTLSILASLLPARQACSGMVRSKNQIEEQLSAAEAKTFRVQSMVNKNKNLSSKELYEIAQDEAFNEDGECPICYEVPMDGPLQTPCRHIFCGDCIRTILQNKSECPMCRKDVNINQLKQPKSCSKENEDEENKKHNHNSSNEEQKYDNGDDEIRFDAKLNRLMIELRRLRQSNRNEKALIFTSFSKSLDWICSELKKNGFEYRTLTGSMSMNKRKKQLDEFSNNPNVDVFVLTVRSGAVGLTLTAANHVFMMEPTLNPALYLQAINRVYRLGQTKKVFIHTLIMKGSIEER